MRRYICAIALAASGGAGAHGLGTPGSASLWLPLSLAAVGLLYAWGLYALWRRAGVGRGVPVWRALAYFAGVEVLTFALTVLDGRADTFFAWHMVQHLLLITVAAPLLVLGTPLYVLAWVLPLAWRRRAARAWHRAPVLRSLWAWLGHPVTVWLLATVVFWAWHVPPFYEAAVRDDRLHALEHLSFVVTAALFWWVALQPQGRRSLSLGVGVVYLFVTALQGSLLGALLVFARAPLYAGYAGRALAGGRDPLTDQQLAGLVMWIPSGVVYLSLAAVFFVRWLRDEEQGQRAREGRDQTTQAGTTRGGAA